MSVELRIVLFGAQPRVSETTMTTSEPTDPLGHPVAPPASVDPFLEAKLTSPPNRDNWVQRDRLIEAMDRAARHPVTLVAGPGGLRQDHRSSRSG